MVIAAAHKKHLDVLWFLLLAGGVGTFLSFIKLGYHAFLHGEYDGQVQDANPGQTVAMVSVAALCVVFGLYPPALFAILPGSFTYTAFSVPHVFEGVVLAVTGIVGFWLLKEPLEQIGLVPDIDRLSNPLALYGTRGIVLSVTELYAAVDAAVVEGARATTRLVSDPRGTARTITGEESVSIRAGFGASILLVVVALVVTLALVL